MCVCTFHSLKVSKRRDFQELEDFLPTEDAPVFKFEFRFDPRTASSSSFDNSSGLL